MELPVDGRRYSLEIHAADGGRQRMGRYRVKIDGATVRATNRRGDQVIAEITPTSTERTRHGFTLHAEDGSWWVLASCNCGG